MKPDWSSMTKSQVCEYFAQRLGTIYTNRTAGDFTFTGVLYEYFWAMGQAKD